MNINNLLAIPIFIIGMFLASYMNLQLVPENTHAHWLSILFGVGVLFLSFGLLFDKKKSYKQRYTNKQEEEE